MNKQVDTRHLKDGKIRLRFWLLEQSEVLVNKSISHALLETGYQSGAAALDVIALSYIAGQCGAPNPAAVTDAETSRWLVKLYPDQYESVRVALDKARDAGCEDDAAALTHVCLQFLKEN